MYILQDTALLCHWTTKCCDVIVSFILYYRFVFQGLKYPGLPVTEEDGKIFTIDLKDPQMKPVELRMSRNFDLESFNPHGISAFIDKKNGNDTHMQLSTKSLHQHLKPQMTSDFELLNLTDKKHNAASTHN